MEGGQEIMKLGKSILVPSVQELVKGNNLVRVPDGYIRNDHHHQDQDHHDSDDDLQVPIIDMQGLITGDHGDELQKLHIACQQWGFFQVINHGVSSSMLEKFKREAQEFLNLPLEEKKKYWQSPTDLEGFGQAFVISEEQKLDWADMFYMTTLPKHQRRPNLFPMLPLPFRDTLENYSAAIQSLTMKILDSMAKALNIDVEVLRNAFGEGNQSMRMTYYPPCPQPEKVVGLAPHSDAIALTILLQLNEMEGLQIKKDGRWVLVKPLPDAFVVNVGDILEIVTNGIYRSIVHRAVANARKERVSVATFYSPALDREICPLPSLITPQSPPIFRKISMVDYWKGFFSRPLDGKSYLHLMRN